MRTERPVNLNRARLVLYCAAPVWLFLQYLSLSNVNPTLPRIQFCCSPGFGNTFSYIPVHGKACFILARAQPILAFPLRQLLRAAQTSLQTYSEPPPDHWAFRFLTFCYPFSGRDTDGFKPNFVFLTLLSGSLQCLIVFVTLLAFRRPLAAA